MSTSATPSIRQSEMAKRIICFAAHGWRSPFAAEYSMAKPKLAMAQSSRTRPQLTLHSFSASERWGASASMAVRFNIARPSAVSGQGAEVGNELDVGDAPRRIAQLRL